MSENNEPTEIIEGVGEPFSDEEIADFIDRGGEAPSFHPILMVWREVLKPARDEADKKVTPQWASRIVQSYHGLVYGDMDVFKAKYYAKLFELLEILEAEIATDEDCLTYTTPAEDVEHNSGHYKTLLLCWQQAFLAWEMDWTCTDEHAAVELAAISEVHKMFFSPTGITAFLDNIKFEFTEDDQAELAAALQAQKEGR